VEVEGEAVRLTPDWLERLDDQRRAGGEIDNVDVSGRVDAGADTLARQELETRRREFLEWRERRKRRRPPKQSGTPAGRAAVERGRRARAAGLAAERERALEAERASEVGRARAFVLDKLRSSHLGGRIRLSLLRDVWRDEGGDPWSILPAVEALGCRVERLPEFGNAQFVYPPSEEVA
jgi:hypothetical protein